MKESVKEEKSIIFRALSLVERVGNKMPDPLSLFFIFCLIVLILSAVISGLGVTAIHPRDGSEVRAVNMLSVNGLRDYISSIVSYFQGFPPLALVLVVILGVGVAEKSGLIETALRASVTNLPKGLITVIIIFLGILSNTAGDSGFIVLPPLAAIVFMSVGRHPLIGLFAAYASVAAGFAANVIINLSDVLAASFTIPAAQMIDPSFTASPAMNYWFLLASSGVLVITGWFVTEKIVAPRFEGVDYIKNEENSSVVEVSAQEKKALRFAGISFLITCIIIVILCLGETPFLADPQTNSLISVNAPLMRAIIPIVTVLFLIPGLVYGIAAGTIKKDTDAVRMMGKAMGEMGPYIVMAFGASQFLAVFTRSNLGIMLAINGAQILTNIGATGIAVMVGFIIFSSFVNLFIGSASAKWAILAPIFVPMFMLVGFDPALTQIAYRIGDSITNPISPLFPYFPIILGYINKYDKNAGIGTIISNMLPYSAAFFVVWTILLFVFVIFGIPLGF